VEDAPANFRCPKHGVTPVLSCQNIPYVQSYRLWIDGHGGFGGHFEVHPIAQACGAKEQSHEKSQATPLR
jgi:hypothetical protein